MPELKCARRAPIAMTATPEDDLQHRSLEELWDRLRSASSPETAERVRNHFIERYLPLVRLHAQRLHSRLPSEVDVEDLVSVGFFGLLNAIDGYDASRGIKFETYCAPRIRGAMLDELRAIDWVPRVVRLRAGMMQKAQNALAMQMGRPPTRQEVANWLGVDRSEYDRIERDSQQTTLTSIHASPRDAEGGETGEIGVLCDDAQADPAAVAQRSDLRELVTKGFSRAERLIIILYYYESMTMKEIGLTLALSESRVSQMHASVLRRLRAKLQHRADELALDDAPPIAGRIP